MLRLLAALGQGAGVGRCGGGRVSAGSEGSEEGWGDRRGGEGRGDGERGEGVGAG